MEWRKGADWLVRAVCAPDSTEEGEAGGRDLGGPDCENDPAYAHAWEEADGCGFWECEDRAGACMPTSTRPGVPDRDGGPPTAPGRTVAAAEGSIGKGQVAATLRNRGVLAAWIIPGEHWWPPPRVGHQWEANVKWQLVTCGKCRHERASLVATRPIEQGSEFCAETGYPGQVYLPDKATLHLVMGGSAKGRTAGAGAVLWGMGDHGRWQRIVAEAAISIGSKTSPTSAEAWGLSAAADLLLAYSGLERKVHIGGDCSMLMKFCAEQKKMREFVAQRVAERALACLAGAGWTCAWTIVPRKHNCAADFVAKRARGRALARNDADFGTCERRARVSWFVHGSGAPVAQPQLAPCIPQGCGGR